MKNNVDLTQGNITKALVKLALPIMGTSFVQMAYNMADMMWIGRIGSAAVAAVGTAGFFMWLSMAFITLTRVGAEVNVSQSVGKKDGVAANGFARNAMQMNLLLALTYTIVLLLFKDQFIGFFKIDDPYVNQMGVVYLTIISLGMVFSFANPVFTGIMNGFGNSRTPFLFNTVGLLMNLILDPLLIFGYGPFPAMGVAGAAIATVISQMTITIIFIVHIKSGRSTIGQIKFIKKPNPDRLVKIVKIGWPVALQSGLFTAFSMILARVIALWGPTPIAVQKVGSQIEAISWMTASGFSVALSTFVGQNYGAGKLDRVKSGYFKALGIMTVVGLGTSALLIFAGEQIFSIFIPEEEAISLGVDYLRILGFSQLFMCVEITTMGALNGLGKTLPPSVISIIFTGLRIPMAIVLSSEALLGLNGIWWSISISSILKGVFLLLFFGIYIIKVFNPRMEAGEVLL